MINKSQPLPYSLITFYYLLMMSPIFINEMLKTTFLVTSVKLRKKSDSLLKLVKTSFVFRADTSRVRNKLVQ